MYQEVLHFPPPPPNIDNGTHANSMCCHWKNYNKCHMKTCGGLSAVPNPKTLTESVFWWRWAEWTIFGDRGTVYRYGLVVIIIKNEVILNFEQSKLTTYNILSLYNDDYAVCMFIQNDVYLIYTRAEPKW
jgi:hypothetical protein